LQHRQLDGLAGQVGSADATLYLEALGVVVIAEQRDAVRLQRDDSLQGLCKTFGRLQRQAVEQVDVDRAVLQGSGGFDDRLGLFQSLHAVDGALDLRVQCLNADADAVESQLTEQAHG